MRYVWMCCSPKVSLGLVEVATQKWKVSPPKSYPRAISVWNATSARVIRGRRCMHVVMRYVKLPSITS